MKLKEVRIVYCVDIAGYNLERIDPTALNDWITQQMKSYVGAKDIGILGESDLTITPKE